MGMEEQEGGLPGSSDRRRGERGQREESQKEELGGAGSKQGKLRDEVKEG